MSRTDAIARIEHYFDSDEYFEELSRRVAFATESQDPERRPELSRYLEDEIAPSFEKLGFSCQTFESPLGASGPPFLVARRHEGDDLLTVFGYGHGDVVRGYDDQWQEGLSPRRLQKVGIQPQPAEQRVQLPADTATWLKS